jgi:hypothetical protein
MNCRRDRYCPNCESPLYCKQVRVAPTEIPYSHPGITLSIWVRDDLGLLSMYLHLLVNWLEIEAVSQFIAWDRVLSHVRALPFYRWIYRAVTDDWEALGALYREQGLLPVRLATDMSADDLKLAALVDESSAQ